MNLKAKLWIWAALLYLVMGLAAWQLWSIDRRWFLLAEVMILVSMAVFWWFQNSWFRPIKAISEGVHLLEDQDFNTRLAKVGQPELDQLISVYNHMVDALRQERLRQEEAQYFMRKLLEASPQGILILDFEGRIQEANPAALQLLGLENQKVRGLSLGDLPKQWSKILLSLKEQKTPIVRMATGRSYSLEMAAFMDRGFKRPFIIIKEQTLEVMELERQAYGKVIRMMSHEVNNSAGAINSMLSWLQGYKDYLPPEEQPDFVSALEVSITRNDHLSGFMSRLASLVKLPQPQRVSMDIHQLLRSVVRLMEPKLRLANIQLQLNIDQQPMMILADAVLMEQVLVNIFQNAAEAIREDGIIQVSSSRNPRVLFVKNNGEPIPDEVRPRLFTPFFSTKKNGQGVGLTLIREVLGNHGFSYNLETLDDGFTCFQIGMETVQQGFSRPAGKDEESRWAVSAQ